MITASRTNNGVILLFDLMTAYGLLRTLGPTRSRHSPISELFDQICNAVDHGRQLEDNPPWQKFLGFSINPMTDRFIFGRQL